MVVGEWKTELSYSSRLPEAASGLFSGEMYRIIISIGGQVSPGILYPYREPCLKYQRNRAEFTPRNTYEFVANSRFIQLEGDCIGN